MLNSLIDFLLEIFTRALAIRHWPYWGKVAFLTLFPVSAPAWLAITFCALCLLLVIYLANWALDVVNGRDKCVCYAEGMEGRCVDFVRALRGGGGGLAGLSKQP
ncbi:hypothetical protein [Emcibacter sp. SYSU 3D8]|uniref:hypothetical protein n=1 Tax=Emcibacter sp. SYSU 3D8 TaxID=3133969 RepID=UPI0031FF29DB